MRRVCCAGEVMVEMARAEAGNLFRQGLAGDSYNTAIHLARAGLPVDYLTALGDDPFSAQILAELSAEGIGTRDVRQIPGRQVGLYLITNADDGERSFTYWRGQSAARDLFSQPIEIPDADIFYFTGITLAVTREHLGELLATLTRLQQRGSEVVFDPNYRPGLWDSNEQARAHYEIALPFCDVVLPTLDDERELWGLDSVDACREYYERWSIRELVVKADDLVCHVFGPEGHEQMAAEPVNAVDTTGAGDAFNAGYLAARWRGGSTREAMAAAQALAAGVVQHPGAIAARTAD